MARVIRKSAYEFKLDDERNLLYVVGSKLINVFDINANISLVAKLKGINNPNQVYIDKTNNQIIVKSTTGEFGVFDRNTYQLVSKLKIQKVINTECDFEYDETQQKAYAVMTLCTLKSSTIKYSLVIINCKDNSYRCISLDTEKTDNMYDKYSIYKVENGKIYILHSATDLNTKQALGNMFECVVDSDGRLQENQIMSNELDWGLVQSIGDGYLSSFSVLFNVNDQSFVNLREKLGIKDYINKIRRSKDKFLAILPDEIFVLDNNLNFLNSYKDLYMSSYLETDKYIFVGTWEKFAVYEK